MLTAYTQNRSPNFVDPMLALQGQLTKIQSPVLTFMNGNYGPDNVVKLVRMISYHNAIKVLNLAFNAIDDTAILGINEYLISNKFVPLEKLNLSGNRITEEGAKKLLEALRSNTQLQELELRGNIAEPKIQVTTLEAIAEILARNKKCQTMSFKL